MYCKHCKTAMQEHARFCLTCGQPAQKGQPPAQATAGLVGYSNKINDPAFAKYIKSSNRYAAIFSMILAAAALIGFYIAGEMGAEGMENPQSLYIGMGIGGMFLLLALFQILCRKGSHTWDGYVADKIVKRKSRRRHMSGDDDSFEDYTEYAVIIRDEKGKAHRLVAEDDDTVFNYYRLGDRVRRHAGLNSYEKYDKSRDRILFCNACGTLCQIGDETCFRCKCPLLK
ncbi:MAG: hypothetical protein EOM66_05225 [Clostridia bacterium]|nr:hypothetical protein [Candidatus Pelethousia sp.]NCB30792.1 hypothetical protein [Clostridia bacterium]